jgi:hypothetical protein
MNDIKIRSIQVKLDKERNLIFDLNAFEELENIYGTLDKALEDFSKSPKKIGHLKNFLFAGLVHEDETLTPKIVGTMIGYENLTSIVDMVWDAITNALPEPKEEVTPSGEN